MELPCASRLTQRAAARAVAPPVLSLVPNTLATIPARQSLPCLAQIDVSSPLTDPAPPLPYSQPSLPTEADLSVIAPAPACQPSPPQTPAEAPAAQRPSRFRPSKGALGAPAGRAPPGCESLCRGPAEAGTGVATPAGLPELPGKPSPAAEPPAVFPIRPHGAGGAGLAQPPAPRADQLWHRSDPELPGTPRERPRPRSHGPGPWGECGVLGWLSRSHELWLRGLAGTATWQLRRGPGRRDPRPGTPPAASATARGRRACGAWTLGLGRRRGPSGTHLPLDGQRPPFCQGPAHGRALALLRDAPHRPPLPKPDPPEAEEAAHILLPLAGAGTGAPLPAPEVPGFGRESGAGQGPAHDRRTGQDVVPESAHKVAAPNGGRARGGEAPRGPVAPAPAAGRAAAAAAAAAAPGPALPAQLVALRAAEPAALGRGQQGGFRVRARLGGVSGACPTGRALFSGPRRLVEHRAQDLGGRGCPRMDRWQRSV